MVLDRRGRRLKAPGALRFRVCCEPGKCPFRCGSAADGNTDVVDKCFLRVDVTDEFPFLVTKLSPYYDR